MLNECYMYIVRQWRLTGSCDTRAMFFRYSDTFSSEIGFLSSCGRYVRHLGK